MPHPNLRRPRRTSPSASIRVLPCSFVMLAAMRLCKMQVGIVIHTWQTTIKYSYKNTVLWYASKRVLELRTSWGGRPGPSVLTSLTVSCQPMLTGTRFYFTLQTYITWHNCVEIWPVFSNTALFPQMPSSVFLFNVCPCTTLPPPPPPHHLHHSPPPPIICTSLPLPPSSAPPPPPPPSSAPLSLYHPSTPYLQSCPSINLLPPISNLHLPSPPFYPSAPLSPYHPSTPHLQPCSSTPPPSPILSQPPFYPSPSLPLSKPISPTSNSIPHLHHLSVSPPPPTPMLPPNPRPKHPVQSVSHLPCCLW